MIISAGEGGTRTSASVMAGQLFDKIIKEKKVIYGKISSFRLILWKTPNSLVK